MAEKAKKGKAGGGKRGAAVGHSRARARETPPKYGVPTCAADATDVGSRVLWIRELISIGAWVPGVTSHALAYEWQCTANNVGRMAAEAHRQMRMGLTPEAAADMRTMALSFHQKVATEAFAAREFTAATKAMLAYCAVAGLDGPPPAPAAKSSEADLARAAEAVRARYLEAQRREAEAAKLRAPPVEEPTDDEDEDE